MLDMLHAIRVPNVVLTKEVKKDTYTVSANDDKRNQGPTRATEEPGPAYSSSVKFLYNFAVARFMYRNEYGSLVAY
jgi:hypothetical protein